MGSGQAKTVGMIGRMSQLGRNEHHSLGLFAPAQRVLVKGPPLMRSPAHFPRLNIIFLHDRGRKQPDLHIESIAQMYIYTSFARFAVIVS